MKKVLSLVLAAAMTFGMSVVAFAADADVKASLGFSGTISPGSSTSGVQWAIHNSGSVDLGDDVRAGAEYYVEAFGLDVDANGFRKDVDNSDIGTYRSTADFSRNKITLKKKVSKGGELIEDPALKNLTNSTMFVDANGDRVTVKFVGLKVEFKDPIVSVKEKEFDFTVYLAKSGTKLSDTEIQVTGFQENEEIEVDEDDEVNLSDGQYAKALNYSKGVEVDTGNGLFVKTNMFKDQKYYCKSEQDVSSADDEIIAKYPEIDTIYTLYKINMNSASNVVTFDIDDKYYVYNQDGKYIGMTTDKLPMADKYYLATKKIDMDTTAATDEAPADTDGTNSVDVESPITGGDDVGANANDNPGTGANGFVNVAVAAGLVALAAGAVSMKK